tara:strand:- start:6823 stop:9507 length:2685 start_codon:yes stop_codon:yes gene_type:complete
MAPESREQKAPNIIGNDNDSISAASLKQHMITNSLLSDLVNIQTEQLKLNKQYFVFEQKNLRSQAFARQETGIERQSGGGPGLIRSAGGKGIGTGGLGVMDAALLAALFGPELLRRFTQKLDEKARGTLAKVNEVWDKFTPSIDGFSDFDTRPVAMGFTQWNKGQKAGALGKNILRRGFDLGDQTSGIRRLRRAASVPVLKGIKATGKSIENLGTSLATPFTGPRLPLGARLGLRNTLGPKGGMFNQFKSGFDAQNYTAPGLNKFLRKGGGLDDALKSIGNFFKGLKNIRLKNITDGLKGIGLQLKNLSKGMLSGGIQNLGKGLQAAPKGIYQGFKGISGGLNTSRKVIGGGLKATSQGMKRIPILGSLLSAGFGAMEANDEEMERLRKENPMMTDEDINANLKNGTLSKDKNKIVSRSVGAGLGAGAGTALGFAIAGPIGAALGAWLGENLGKFLGEGIGSVFKGFDWGETFRPVLNVWKEMTTGIGDALNGVAKSFGIGGDDSGGGFITAIKNIGRIIGIIAKILIKTLVPILQMALKTIQWAVQIIGKVVEGLVWLVKGIGSLLGGIINRIPDWVPGSKALKGMLAGFGEAMSGDVLGNINSFVDNTNTALPTEQGRKDRAEGQGGGSPGLILGGGTATGIGGGDIAKPTNETAVLTHGRKTASRPNHQGIDIGFAGDKGGQPMFLPNKAKITSNGLDPNGYGNYITFTTQNDGLTHLYGHMQNKSPLEQGKMFPGGTFAGKMGNTGTSSAPHLHWEIGTVEADVGRGGPSLKDPREFGYSLQTPFEKVASATANMSTSSSSTNTNVSASQTTNNGAKITPNTSNGSDQAAAISTMLQSTNAGAGLTGGSGMSGGNSAGNSYDIPPWASGIIINTESSIDDGGIVFPHSVN